MAKDKYPIELFPNYSKKEIIIGYVMTHNNLVNTYAIVPGTDKASFMVAEIIRKALKRSESRGWT